MHLLARHSNHNPHTKTVSTSLNIHYVRRQNCGAKSFTFNMVVVLDGRPLYASKELAADRFDVRTKQTIFNIWNMYIWIPQTDICERFKFQLFLALTIQTMCTFCQSLSSRTFGCDRKKCNQLNSMELVLNWKLEFFIRKFAVSYSHYYIVVFIKRKFRYVSIKTGVYIRFMLALATKISFKKNAQQSICVNRYSEYVYVYVWVNFFPLYNWHPS